MPLSPARFVCCIAMASALAAPLPARAAGTAFVAQPRSPVEPAPVQLAQKLPDTELPRPHGTPGGAPGMKPAAPTEEPPTRRAGPAKKKDATPAAESKEKEKKDERNK